MVRARKLNPLPLMDEPALLSFLRERGYKDVHATTLCHEVIKRRTEDLLTLAGPKVGKPWLPPGMVEEVAQVFAITTSKVVEVSVGDDETLVPVLS